MWIGASRHDFTQTASDTQRGGFSGVDRRLAHAACAALVACAALAACGARTPLEVPNEPAAPAADATTGLDADVTEPTDCTVSADHGDALRDGDVAEPTCHARVLFDTVTSSQPTNGGWIGAVERMNSGAWLVMEERFETVRDGYRQTLEAVWLDRSGTVERRNTLGLRATRCADHSVRGFDACGRRIVYFSWPDENLAVVAFDPESGLGNPAVLLSEPLFPFWAVGTQSGYALLLRPFAVSVADCNFGAEWQIRDFDPRGRQRFRVTRSDAGGPPRLTYPWIFPRTGGGLLLLAEDVGRWTDPRGEPTYLALVDAAGRMEMSYQPVPELTSRHASQSFGRSGDGTILAHFTPVGAPIGVRHTLLRLTDDGRVLRGPVVIGDWPWLSVTFIEMGGVDLIAMSELPDSAGPQRWAILRVDAALNVHPFARFEGVPCSTRRPGIRLFAWEHGIAVAYICGDDLRLQVISCE